MSSKPQPRAWDQPTRRRRLRYPVLVPLDVTVLRSGIPDTLPGRSVDLGEGGVAAMLAGELLPGESVGIEIHLPVGSKPLRARALVRHHDRLRAGMEFVGLTSEQQAAIQICVRANQVDREPRPESPTNGQREIIAAKKSAVRREVEVRVKGPSEDEKSRATSGLDGTPTPAYEPPSAGAGAAAVAPRRRRGGWLLLLLAVAIVSGALWWRWNRGWQELESGLRNENRSASLHPQANISADTMQKRITHRVDPEYPAAARPFNLRGVIVLDVVVGRDGSVIDLHAQNGPDILAHAAIDALRWWRFEPYSIDGQPAVVQTTVAVEFNP